MRNKEGKCNDEKVKIVTESESPESEISEEEEVKEKLLASAEDVCRYFGW
jgi:hypothetical protein